MMKDPKPLMNSGTSLVIRPIASIRCAFIIHF